MNRMEEERQSKNTTTKRRRQKGGKRPRTRQKNAAMVKKRLEENAWMNNIIYVPVDVGALAQVARPDDDVVHLVPSIR